MAASKIHKIFFFFSITGNMPTCEKTNKKNALKSNINRKLKHSHRCNLIQKSSHKSLANIIEACDGKTL